MVNEKQTEIKDKTITLEGKGWRTLKQYTTTEL